MTKIRVTATIPNQETSTESSAGNFWNYIKQNFQSSRQDLSEISDSEFELALQQNFGLNLKYLIMSYFGHHNLRGEFPYKADSMEAERRALTGIFFKVSNIEYGSLIFDVDITGLKKLVEVFDNNFELFEMVMESYIPKAFNSSVIGFEYQYYYDDENLIAQKPLEWKFDIPEDIKSEFLKSPASTDQSTEQTEGKSIKISRGDKLEKAWFIANTSLIVPVALAFGIAYYLYQNLGSQSQILETRMQQLWDFQMTTLEKERERAESFKATEQKLIDKALSEK